MDYEKKYKEALGKAKEIIKYYKERNRDEAAIEDLQEIFPELKESDDERIRKELISFFSDLPDSDTFRGILPSKVIAWLEKQGNQTIFNTPSRETILAIWELGNDWKELTNGVISTEHGTQLDYIQKHWSESEHYLRERRKQKPTSNEQQGKSALEAIHEQNPNNKPKFNVDDWICNDACIVHIVSIKDDMYYFDEGDGLDIAFVDNNYHLWGITDAKDGDVLSYENEIFIVKKSVNLNILYYCCYDGEHFIIDSFYSLTIDDINNIRPATKEQRDLLFKKMKENGYEWDAEKKELKKIENEHICELDNSYTCVKFPFKAKVKSSGTIVTIHNGQLSSDGKEWIKYQSDAEDGYKIYEPNNLELVCEIKQKPAWSEEDEDNLTDTCVAIRKFYHGNNGAQDLIDWLQSIKQKKSWKPSDKQIRALRWVLNNIPYNTHKEEISGLLEQIKDL